MFCVYRSPALVVMKGKTRVKTEHDDDYCPQNDASVAINIPTIARATRIAQSCLFRIWVTGERGITEASFATSPRSHCPASELRGNNLVELRMNANSEVT